jgi:hypothetical protein
LNLNLMVCHSAEPRMEKFIKEPLEVNPKTLVLEDKLTDAALLLTELDTLCFTLYSVELLVMTVSSSLSTLHLIC